MTKPICCDRPMVSNGKTRWGEQRYRCLKCGKSTTGNPDGRPKVSAGACPKCGSTDTKKIGGGSGDRVFCYGCQKSSVLNPQKRGRKPKKPE